MQGHLALIPLGENIFTEDLYLVYLVIFIIDIPKHIIPPGKAIGERTIGAQGRKT